MKCRANAVVSEEVFVPCEDPGQRFVLWTGAYQMCIPHWFRARRKAKAAQVPDSPPPGFRLA